MDFPILKRRFLQFGGLRLVLAYARLNVMGTIIREFCGCLVHRRSFKAIYPAIGRKVDGVLIERFLVEDYGQGPREQVASERVIWWSWLQGEDKAPEIVRACLALLRRNVTDWEIRIVDGGNWRKYIDLPDYIAAMPYGYSLDSPVLMHNWNRPYIESNWKKIVNHAVFHKLSFRVSPETLGNGGNLYYEILRRY